MADYSIWLLEYARAENQPVETLLAGQFDAGTTSAPFCYGVIRGEGHCAMVDVGYENARGDNRIAEISGCSKWQPPEVVLASVGLEPDDIDTVFLTHAHFDHMGNLPAFPNAHFYLQRRELERWIWALSLPRRFGWITVPVDANDIQYLLELTKQHRLTLIDGAMEDVLPGISLVPAHDTHSFGCQYVLVQNERERDVGPWAFVGDNFLTYRNAEGVEGNGVYTPIGLSHCNTVETVLSMDDVVTRVHGDPRRLIIFHEEQSWTVFPSWQGKHGLRVAEITLAEGESSSIPIDRR